MSFSQERIFGYSILKIRDGTYKLDWFHDYDSCIEKDKHVLAKYSVKTRRISVYRLFRNLKDALNFQVLNPQHLVFKHENELELLETFKEMIG